MDEDIKIPDEIETFNLDKETKVKSKKNKRKLL